MNSEKAWSPCFIERFTVTKHRYKVRTLCDLQTHTNNTLSKKGTLFYCLKASLHEVEMKKEDSLEYLYAHNLEVTPPHPPTQNSFELVQFEKDCSPESCFGALRLLVLAYRSLTWLKCVLLVDKNCRQRMFLLVSSRRYFTSGASLALLYQLNCLSSLPESLITSSNLLSRSLSCTQERQDQYQTTQADPSTIQL